MAFADRLRESFPESWQEMLAVIRGESDWRNHPAAIARESECYNPPDRIDVKLHVLNAIAGTCGPEYLAARDDTFRNATGVEYLNTGHTYTSTLCWDHARQKWFVSSWGDVVEAQPERFA